MAGGIALVLSSCSTGQMAVQNASNDDVYNSTVEARPITYAARTTNNYSDSEYNTNDSYYDESYNSRLSIDNRNPISWRDNYYNNYLSYDPFYFDPLYSNWYTPGFSVGLGWNSWGGSSWSLGWNNWGWNNWGWNSMAYNPWYSPYNSPFWGPYSYYGYGYGRPYYGGYWGGGYWGGGYYGGGYWGSGVINRNPGVARPDRGSSSGRVSTARPGTNQGNTSGRIQRPTSTTRPGVSTNDRYPSDSGRPSRTSSSPERPNRTETQSRPETQTRPTRTETQQARPTRTESPASSRPSIERSSPQPSYSPSSGGSSGGGGRSSSGGSSRPSR